MSPNPFFSGRISQQLFDAVEKHRQQSGESKTDVLVKALSAYVNAPIEVSPLDAEDKSKLQALENRVVQIEQVLASLQLPPSAETTAQNLQGQTSLHNVESTDNNFDNKVDNTLAGYDNSVINVDNSDQSQFELWLNEQTNPSSNLSSSKTTKEVAEALSWSYDKVQSRHKRDQAFSEKGYKFTPAKEKGKPVWRVEVIEDKESNV